MNLLIYTLAKFVQFQNLVSLRFSFCPSLTITPLNAPYSQFEFTQMYLVGVSNVIGVSLWNSYQTNYPGAVYIQADGTLSMSLTNDLGPLSPPVVATASIGGANPAPMGSINIPATQWQGSGWVPGSLVKPN